MSVKSAKNKDGGALPSLAAVEASTIARVATIAVAIVVVAEVHALHAIGVAAKLTTTELTTTSVPLAAIAVGSITICAIGRNGRTAVPTRVGAATPAGVVGLPVGHDGDD